MDIRIERSREALKNAYKQLIKSEDPNRITVKELCAEAGVNRSTFYQHFGYLDDLVNAVINDSVLEMCSGFENVYDLPKRYNGIDRDVIISYIKRFLQNEVLLRLCQSEDSRLFYSMIINSHQQITLNSRGNSTINDSYSAYFQNAGCLATLMLWISRGMDLPIEDMAEIIHRFSRSL